MYEFVVDQVLGINGLINFSNIVFLVAFSVRDVLKLRILAMVGEGLTLPYYYFQGEKLWPPIVWGAPFMLVNAVRVVATAFLAAAGSSQRQGRTALPRRIRLDRQARVLEARQPCPVGRLLAWGGYSRKGAAHIRGDCLHRRGPRSHC